MLTLTIPALLRLNKSFLVHTVLLLPYLEPATNPGIGIRGCVPVCDGCWSPYPGSVITPSSGPRVRVWGHMVSADREPITGVLVQSPQRGARAEPLVRGSNWCRQLFLHLHNLTNWPICPKIRVFAKQKISSDVWGKGMPHSLCPWIRQWSLPGNFRHVYSVTAKDNTLRYYSTYNGGPDNKWWELEPRAFLVALSQVNMICGLLYQGQRCGAFSSTYWIRRTLHILTSHIWLWVSSTRYDWQMYWIHQCNGINLPDISNLI